MTCEPLINLTRKNVKFNWNDECDKAFETIKNALLNPPILAFPDPNKRFILYTDASDKAIGAVLKQEYGNIEKNRSLSISQLIPHTTTLAYHRKRMFCDNPLN